MKYTTNLNLKKPDYAELADIGDMNANMDILDDALTAHKSDNTAHVNARHKVNVDFNTLDKTGFYIAEGTSLVNSPTGTASGVFYIEVIEYADGTNHLMQLAYSLYETQHVYRRQKINGTWGSWFDIYQYSNTHIASLVTNSGGVHGLQIEEGAWTPIIAGLTTAGVNTYNKALGRYKKIGNQVTCYFSVVMTAKDASMAGAVILSQLPFAISTMIGNMAGGTLAAFSNITLDTGFTQLGLESGGGTSYMLLRQYGSNKIATVLDSTKIADNTEIRGEITYLI